MNGFDFFQNHQKVFLGPHEPTGLFFKSLTSSLFYAKKTKQKLMNWFCNLALRMDRQSWIQRTLPLAWVSKKGVRLATKVTEKLELSALFNWNILKDKNFPGRNTKKKKKKKKANCHWLGVSEQLGWFLLTTITKNKKTISHKYSH